LLFLKIILYFCASLRFWDFEASLKPIQKQKRYKTTKFSKMIQRVQSIYLLIVVALNAALPWVFPLWKTETGTEVFAVEKPLVLGAFCLSGLLALIAIFRYKNRKSQFVLGRLNIVLNFVLLGFFVYWLLMM